MRSIFVFGVLLVLIIPFVFSQVNESLDDIEEVAPAPNESFIEEDLTVLEKSDVSSSLIIKIFILVLVILAVAGFFIYNKTKKGNEVPVQGETVEKVSRQLNSI